MSDIEIVQEREVARASDSRYFKLIMEQAEILSESRVVPAAYRGRAADIVAAGLAGRGFGWDVMTSMRTFHVIDGTASMRPEAMLGLVRRAGHSVTIEAHSDYVTATGIRSDNGDTHEATFTMEDAGTAGLAGKKNWQQYPEAMLTWRAVSKLCRNLFSDVVLGAGYVPEEVGADVYESGDPIRWISSAVAKKLLIDTHGLDKAKELWGDQGNSTITEDDLHALMSTDDPKDEYIDVEATTETTTDKETKDE